MSSVVDGCETILMGGQLEKFRSQLLKSVSIKERIRTVTMDIDATNRLLHSSLLFLHRSPLPEVLEKARVLIGTLKKPLSQLAEILQDCPGEYYRYHGDWKSEMQTAVSLLCFIDWVDTGKLLTHREIEETFGLDPLNFGLDVEDYLIGVCFMSSELPQYVVNQVSAGDYNCPRRAFKFLTDLYEAFRMLNLRNDFLRKKFDGIKYDLVRVTEVYHDVKIRGLMPSEEDMTMQREDSILVLKGQDIQT
ncbi:hypothetical protein Nepgr_013092 [Nepenthes gracilis]|uniref:Translin n=1 Tax=Nepenthes gracilis TaxID=150966 RepID=A0AAD3XNZ0_NEPGR|nr:hypothetical protein Nepgr_013092 [Nepenthes gracilis]